MKAPGEGRPSHRELLRNGPERAPTTSRWAASRWTMAGPLSASVRSCVRSMARSSPEVSSSNCSESRAISSRAWTSKPSPNREPLLPPSNRRRPHGFSGGVMRRSPTEVSQLLRAIPAQLPRSSLVPRNPRECLPWPRRHLSGASLATRVPRPDEGRLPSPCRMASALRRRPGGRNSMLADSPPPAAVRRGAGTRLRP